MNRRTLMRTAGVGAALAVAGCLEADDEPTVDPDDGSPSRYDRPTYSEWPPAESHDGSGVVFAQLRLEAFQSLQTASGDGRLDTSQPLVGLPHHGIERIATAVESLSRYPFDATLRQAVNAAVSPLAEQADGEHNRTVVEPATEPISPATDSTDQTTSSPDTNTSSTDDELATATDEQNTTANETTATDEPEPVTAADIGIEPDRIALVDEVLLFEGSFDHSAFVEQFADSFERVDTQRGIAIYEGTDELSGLAFALSGRQLLVPTETHESTASSDSVDGESAEGGLVDDEPVDGETTLAHVMSGYISTLGRIVDAADGQWLFETTGRAAVSVGLWNVPTASEFLAETAVDTERQGLAAVCDAADSCLSVIKPPTDRERSTGFEARFSGLFPDGPPSDDELRSVLVGDFDPEVVYSDAPRVHVSATVDDR